MIYIQTVNWSLMLHLRLTSHLCEQIKSTKHGLWSNDIYPIYLQWLINKVLRQSFESYRRSQKKIEKKNHIENSIE